MNTTYTIERDGQILRVGFGEPANMDAIVRDAAARLKDMADAHELESGGIIGINGPISVQVAIVIAHAVAHLFSAVAAWVPPLNSYVVCISHDPRYTVGQLLDRSVIEAPDPTV